MLLEEHDPIWLELRHAHIADVSLMPRYLFLFGNGKKLNFWTCVFRQASERLHDKMTNFLSKNKAAQLQGKRWVLLFISVVNVTR